jgi:TolB protein
VVSADGRAYAPTDAWVSADDGFDPRRQREETRYFHCTSQCTVLLPEGDAQITVWRGQEYEPVQQSVRVNAPTTVALALQPLTLPDWAPGAVTADLHVHMNYGGHYRHTTESLALQALAEDLDVVYNTIVNKEQRIPDIGEFNANPRVQYGVMIQPAQEYHTSFWGHLGLLHLDDHFLTPDFSAYQASALTSPWPHNGAVADLAHRQSALVGYVHPYDWEIHPDKEKSLTHALPADVALGKTDYLEVVGFSDHKATAAVWHGLLNLGFRVPAGAGTDAMANYASLRGPVGMNRVYLHTKDATPAALRAALKDGRSVASNGPQLAFQLEENNPGDTVHLPVGGRRVQYRAALRSPVPIDHLEVVHNGRVVATHRFGKDRKRVDFDGAVTVRDSGWILLRAWNDEAHPLIFDLYPYATTSPVYVEIAGRPVRSAKDAAFFVTWLDRVIAAADARSDYNTEAEKEDTLAYLRAARAVFESKAAPEGNREP